MNKENKYASLFKPEMIPREGHSIYISKLFESLSQEDMVELDQAYDTWIDENLTYWFAQKNVLCCGG